MTRKFAPNPSPRLDRRPYRHKISSLSGILSLPKDVVEVSDAPIFWLKPITGVEQPCPGIYPKFTNIHLGRGSGGDPFRVIPCLPWLNPGGVVGGRGLSLGGGGGGGWGIIVQYGYNEVVGNLQVEFPGECPTTIPINL